MFYVCIVFEPFNLARNDPLDYFALQKTTVYRSSESVNLIEADSHVESSRCSWSCGNVFPVNSRCWKALVDVLRKLLAGSAVFLDFHCCQLYLAFYCAVRTLEVFYYAESFFWKFLIVLPCGGTNDGRKIPMWIWSTIRYTLPLLYCRSKVLITLLYRL